MPRKPATTYCETHQQAKEQKGSGKWICRRCANEASLRSIAKKRGLDLETYLAATRDKVRRHRAKTAPVKKKPPKQEVAVKRERRLQELGLRHPTCADCAKVEVRAIGNRCKPCAIRAAKKDGMATRVQMRGEPKKDEKPAKVVPIEEQRMNIETAALLIGRDKRIFLVLCEEFGVEHDKNGHYLGADVYRIKAATKERAAEWVAGNRARPY